MDLLAGLHAIVGDRGLLTGADTATFATDWRGLYRGRPVCVVRPASTGEMARVVGLCAGSGIAMVPQGGNTSMVGGATPSEDGTQVVISTARLTAVRALDPLDLTMTVEAGVTLKAAQDAARDAGALLPLSISAEGSAQVGGILATNAGGNNTVRHGNARDLILGLEVVLPDGRVWNGLRRLRKDNTGYALRHLFAGSEGTLGIITAAVLRLVPAPGETAVALCALPSVDAVLALYAAARAHDAGGLQAFEYMSGASMDMVLGHIGGASLPLAAHAHHYALIETSSGRADAGLRAGFEALLGAALDAGTITDAVVAESQSQRLALWKLREEHAEAQKRAGASVKNDVSVPVSRIPALLARAEPACIALVPGIRVAPFGHIGDGNIHPNLVQPVGADGPAFLAHSEDLMDAVNAIVRDLDLKRPIYRKTAAYGHFGRSDKDFTWEDTARADDLKQALGL